jgi:hypothetical protein
VKRYATLDEMYYDPMKARPTRNPPSAWLRLDWFVSAQRIVRMLTKHDEGKMPKNRGHIASLARSYTRTAIKTLAGIMMEQTSPPMARIAAAKVLLDRGWGKCSETHKIDINGETSLLKVVNEIVHVHETREQIEFRDQTPLLELTPEDTDGNGSKSPH